MFQADLLFSRKDNSSFLQLLSSSGNMPLMKVAMQMPQNPILEREKNRSALEPKPVGKIKDGKQVSTTTALQAMADI